MFQNKYLKFALHKFSRAVAIQLLSSNKFPPFRNELEIVSGTPFDIFNNWDDAAAYIQVPANTSEPSKVRVIEFQSNQARDIWVSKFKQTLAEMDKIY